MTDEIERLNEAIARFRRGVTGGTRHRELEPDPIVLFARWLGDALDAEVYMPHAMNVATADVSGVPSSRVALLKGFDDSGFVFYTNYTSRKAGELEANPRASLTFYWSRLERQVRIGGTAARTTAAESDEYFASRPRGSQIGAWASSQSSVIDARSELEAAYQRFDAKFSGSSVPRPPHWGGYRVEPREVEFWQGQPNRLHDRWLYTRGDGEWTITRLAP